MRIKFLLLDSRNISKGTYNEIFESEGNIRGREIFSRMKDRGFMVAGRPLSVLYGQQGWSAALSQISATLRRLVLFSSLPCAPYTHIDEGVCVCSRTHYMPVNVCVWIIYKNMNVSYDPRET